MKTTSDCIQIAAAGGGLDLSKGGKTTNDLIMIAAAAANSGKNPQIWISGSKTTPDLLQIVSAGKGCVLVKFD